MILLGYCYYYYTTVGLIAGLVIPTTLLLRFPVLLRVALQAAITVSQGTILYLIQSGECASFMIMIYVRYNTYTLYILFVFIFIIYT